MSHFCLALDFFSWFSAAILIVVDSTCDNIYSGFLYKTQKNAFATIWLIHRKEMCRFGLTSGRTRQANIIFVSCEWIGLKNKSSSHFWLVYISHTCIYCAVAYIREFVLLAIKKTVRYDIKWCMPFHMWWTVMCIMLTFCWESWHNIWKRYLNIIEFARRLSAFWRK
jgi:hypothetical protein